MKHQLNQTGPLPGSSKSSPQSPSERAADSLTPDQLDTLAELVISKLTATSKGQLTLNQLVTGSSPVRLTNFVARRF